MVGCVIYQCKLIINEINKDFKDVIYIRKSVLFIRLFRAHTYDPGFRYTDHTSSDNIANYGIAALVAAAAGGKIAKAGGLVALLAILKKFGAAILALFLGFMYKFKNIFKRKTNE